MCASVCVCMCVCMSVQISMCLHTEAMWSRMDIGAEGVVC